MLKIKNLNIDRYKLEDELETVAVESQECSEELSNKIAERDTAKLEVEEYEAELDIKIRTDTSIKKTETQIKNMIIADSERKRLQRELITLNQDVNNLKALEENFRKKSSALKYLCELWCHAYYTENSVKCEHRQNNSIEADRVQREIRAKLKFKKNNEKE